MSVRDPDELLAAYVDGVGELTTEERKAVEARLAEDPAWRDEADATRGLLSQLRDLPALGAEPDWSAMERAIRDEVGPTAPRAWWRGWRALVPLAALAVAGAVLVLVLRTPERGPEIGARDPVRDAGTPVVSPDPSPKAEPTTAALWLDGAAVEIDLQAAELVDDDEAAAEPELGLIPNDDLAWVDELGEDDVAAAEAWLARQKS